MITALVCVGVFFLVVGLIRVFIVRRSADLHVHRPYNRYPVVTDRSIK